MDTIRTRFAPSPTGFLHIGGARTALFCYLHARRHDGRFVLRIEDTDLERSTQEAVDAIREGMTWLGLHADEGPFLQSERADRHRQVALELLERGRAYRCACTREELDAMREGQRARNEKPRYDGRCRQRRPDPSLPSVIRFKTPMDGETVWRDLIQGTIRYPNDQLDDLVLLRSDGSPTFNLAVTVDDHDMGINLVIRGDDHINNTPRQIHLFEAMEWPVPEYAHMPLLHGADGAKLSKRHGAVSVLQYREEGFLPEAVANYLVRLGWSHGEQEVFTMEEMIRLFDIRQVGKAASIFDQARLTWLNGHHIRMASSERLAELLPRHFARLGLAMPDPARLADLIPTVKERSRTLVEMAEKLRFFLVESVAPYETKAATKHLTPPARQPLLELAAHLAALPDWTLESVTEAFNATLAATGQATGELAQPARVALTGSGASPGIHEVIHLLGREASLARLRRAAEFIASGNTVS